MPPKSNNNGADQLSAGFNNSLGSSGVSDALLRLKALLSGGAPAPTPQGQAQQAITPQGDPNGEQLAKLKALQTLGGVGGQ